MVGHILAGNGSFFVPLGLGHDPAIWAGASQMAYRPPPVVSIDEDV